MMNLQPSPRHLVLVTGMHRSGTSALTRMLNFLGADLGDGLLPAREDNPRGYWEAADIIALNDECLEHFGTAWFDPRPLPQDWEDSPWAAAWQARLRTVLETRYPTAGLVVIKDPRIARLLPAWLNAARDAGFTPHVVLALRNPDEVVASLGKRRDARLTPTSTRLLWLAHLLEGEHASRNASRAVVLHGDLLSDWREVATSLEGQLQLEWPRGLAEAAGEIDGFIDPGLHRQQTGRLVAEREGRLSARCRELYARLDDALPAIPVEMLDHARQRLAEDLELAGTARGAHAHPASAAASESSPAAAWSPSETMTLLARAYFPDAKGRYDETRSQEVTLAPRPGLRTVQFDVPPDAATTRVRFDPAEAPGSYRILAFVVNGKPAAATAATVIAHGGIRLQDDPDGALRIHAGDSDPWVELCFAGVLGAGQALHSLEVRFERDSPFDRLDRQLQEASARQEALARNVDDLDASLRLAQQSILHDQQQLLQRSDATLAQLGALAQALANTRDLGLVALVATSGRAARRAHPAWGGTPLSMQPSNLRPVACNEAAGLQAWDIAGQPTRVLLRPRRTLAPGWYVLAFAMQSAQGEMAPPHLRLDHGDGFDEGSVTLLPLTPGGLRQRPLLRFEQPVHALALEPSGAPGSAFLLGNRLCLRRIPPPEAMFRLGLPAIRRLRAQGAGWRTVAREVRAALGRGTMAALDVLHVNAAVRAPGNSQIPGGYARWIELHDTLDDEARAAMDEAIAAMQAPPLISIVMPAYNTPERWLRRCIESVCAQRYPHWELCIANDASTEPQVRRVLDEYAAAEPRIRVVHRSRNGHISAASNSALELATGDWVALLDHDDELPEHALYHVAEAILAHPEAMLIYSDEDKITEDGERYDPYFKPDWNPQLFLGHNMFSHFGVYNRTLLDAVGGFREGLEGSQDYDLALRCIERVRRDQIIHVPRVLYHWRAIAGSTALAPDEKDYAHQAAQRAISEHLARAGVAAQVEPIPLRAGNWRIRRKSAAPAQKVSIIIPTRNGGETLRRCIDSIGQKTRYPNYEVLVVDNRSDDPCTLDFLADLHGRPGMRSMQFDEPFNFSRMNNAAARQCDGAILLFLNDDTEVITPEWIDEMAALAASHGTGAVGAMLYYPDGRIQHAGIVLGLGPERIAGHAYHGLPRGYPGDKCRAQLVQEVSAVTAACMAVQRTHFDAVGGFDESLAVAYNDVDFCLRLQQLGLRNVWTPNAELYHHESRTRGAETTPHRRAGYGRECAMMRARWGAMLTADPYYHPALSLDRGDFATYVEPRS